MLWKVTPLAFLRHQQDELNVSLGVCGLPDPGRESRTKVAVQLLLDDARHEELVAHWPTTGRNLILSLLGCRELIKTFWIDKQTLVRALRALPVSTSKPTPRTTDRPLDPRQLCLSEVPRVVGPQSIRYLLCTV